MLHNIRSNSNTAAAINNDLAENQVLSVREIFLGRGVMIMII